MNSTISQFAIIKCHFMLQCPYFFARALATTLYNNVFLSFPAHFDTKFVTSGVMVPKLRNFLYTHIGPKKAQNVILCTKSMQIYFFHLIHINMLIFAYQWLKLICFSIIVLQKVSATNFAGKTNKNKGPKNKEIHKTIKYIRN